MWEWLPSVHFPSNNTKKTELGLSGFFKSIYLRDGDSTLFGKFFFGFFAGIRVGQVGVEILVQDLCGLFAEVAPFASDERPTGEKYLIWMPFGHTLLWPRTVCITTHTGLSGKTFSKEFIIHLNISITFISFGEGIWNRQNWRASKLTKTCPDNRWKV